MAAAVPASLPLPSPTAPTAAAAATASGYSTPVVTDATAASPQELLEAAAAFLPGPPSAHSFRRAAGGVNNKCAYVTTPGGDVFVCRVYNNGFNEARVAYEHAVLAALAGKAGALAFAVPAPLRAADGSGATYVRLPSSGAHACVFPCIPGGPPSLGAARAIGRATAALLAALADVVIDAPLPNPLYRNFFDAHHKLTRASFYAAVAAPDPELEAVRPALDALVAEVRAVEALIERIVAGGGLPEQQIHADLHFDNVLVGTGPAGEPVVTGVLDFEFSARDWRVMELVVGLSKYVGTPGIEPVFAEWVAGYAEGGGTLTRAEADLVPDLIILRVLNNVAYFVGRALAGEDSLAPLTGRAALYARRVEWVRERRGWIVDTLAPLVVGGAAAASSASD